MYITDKLTGSVNTVVIERSVDAEGAVFIDIPKFMRVSSEDAVAIANRLLRFADTGIQVKKTVKEIITTEEIWELA